MANRTYRSGSTLNFGFGPGLTPAVKNLIIANGAVFAVSILAGAAGYGYLFNELMLTPYLVTHRYALWQPVTYIFLHAGFFHILFNMLALWMFGSDLERTWGARRFLFYFFLTGIGAGLTVVAVSPNSFVATVGASGAIYGVLLAYGLLFPDRPIFIWFVIPIAAKYLVMIMGAIEFLSAFQTPGDLVSHVAHLGGIAVGFLYLRGRPYYFSLRNNYYRWRRMRLQRQFKVYMNKRDQQDGQGI